MAGYAFWIVKCSLNFYEVMTEVLKPLLRGCVVIYFNGILIFSKTQNQHLKDIRKVFDPLKQLQLRINMKIPTECMLGGSLFYKDMNLLLRTRLENKIR